MRKFFLLLLSFFLASCSFLTDDEIVLSIPVSTYVEDLFMQDIYYTLRYFDGNEVKSTFVGYDDERIALKTKKGYLTLFTLTPADTFSPLGAFHEPGTDKSVSFSYGDGEFFSFLLDMASVRPDLLKNISISALQREVQELDQLSQSAFYRDLENGKLRAADKYISDDFQISTSLLEEGKWYSDRPGQSDFIIFGSGEEYNFTFKEGIYRFIHEDFERMITIVVSEGGESAARISKIPIWY